MLSGGKILLRVVKSETGPFEPAIYESWKVDLNTDLVCEARQGAFSSILQYSLTSRETQLLKHEQVAEV